MSRVTIKTQNHKIVLHVGLDEPMQCYFGHAYALSDHDLPSDPSNDPLDSLWSATNYELCAWMRKFKVDDKDPFTAKVVGLVHGDLDPGEAGSDTSAAQ